MVIPQFRQSPKTLLIWWLNINIFINGCQEIIELFFSLLKWAKSNFLNHFSFPYYSSDTECYKENSVFRQFHDNFLFAQSGNMSLLPNVLFTITTALDIRKFTFKVIQVWFLPANPHRIACVGHIFLHLPHRMHSALLGFSVGSTSIWQIFLHFPQWTHFSLSTL